MKCPVCKQTISQGQIIVPMYSPRKAVAAGFEMSFDLYFSPSFLLVHLDCLESESPEIFKKLSTPAPTSIPKDTKSQRQNTARDAIVAETIEALGAIGMSTSKKDVLVSLANAKRDGIHVESASDLIKILIKEYGR
jgi:hypothetical protein